MSSKGRPKGIVRPPKLALKALHEEVMGRIDGWSAPVGVFIIGGNLRCMRRTAPTFDKYADLLVSGFVGTYDKGADSRVVMDDLRTFYPGETNDK